MADLHFLAVPSGLEARVVLVAEELESRGEVPSAARGVAPQSRRGRVLQLNSQTKEPRRE